jgi:uncharacterized protein (UPF0332 family)
VTEDQAALLEKAGDSLRAARLLAQEGFFDFAVSRAYYTMFYAAEALLLKENLSFSKHSAVIAAFGRHFVKAGHVPPDFHRFLIEGMDSRNVGDYALKARMSKKEAAEQIRRAEKFLEMASHFLGADSGSPS